MARTLRGGILQSRYLVLVDFLDKASNEAYSGASMQIDTSLGLQCPEPISLLGVIGGRLSPRKSNRPVTREASRTARMDSQLVIGPGRQGFCPPQSWAACSEFDLKRRVVSSHSFRLRKIYSSLRKFWATNFVPVVDLGVRCSIKPSHGRDGVATMPIMGVSSLDFGRSCGAAFFFVRC